MRAREKFQIVILRRDYGWLCRSHLLSTRTGKTAYQALSDFLLANREELGFIEVEVTLEKEPGGE